MQPNDEEEASIASHTSKMHDAADVVKDASRGVYTSAGNALDATLAATKVVGGAVTDVAQSAADAARPYVRNQYTEAAAKPFVYAAEPVIQQYNNLLSPVVSGQGEGFGDLVELEGKEEVFLRIEISASSEVKAMRTCSYIVTLFSFLATLALLGMKLNTDANEQLKDSNNYFISSIIISAFFLAILLIVAGVFIRRIINAWRKELVWSRRRRNIAGSAFSVLILQIANLASMLASAAYSVTEICRWQSDPVYILGFIQWSLWNLSLLLLVAFAHNGSFWRGKTKGGSKRKEERKGEKPPKEDGGGADATEALPQPEQPQQPVTALVMDAPIRIHTPKLILWGILQATLIVMLLKYLTRGYGNSCLNEGPLDCAPKHTFATNGLILHLCVIWAYFCTYGFFAWRTDRDLRSRPYTEMRLARMVFGIQHEQVLPVFFTFAVSTTLLIAIEPSNCWTFVQTGMGVVPLQAMGTAMAGSLCFYFMPKKPGSAEEILQTWLQEFAWAEKQMPEAIRRRNAKLAASRTLAEKPMFCIETAIKMLYYSKLVYKVTEEEVLKDENNNSDSGISGGNGGGGDNLFNSQQPPQIEKEKEKESTTTKESNQNTQNQAENNVIADIELGEVGAISLLADLGFSKKLYGLSKAQVFFEESSDTKGILLWGNNTIVVAFKGTSSFENALTDINFLKVNHPPKRMAPMSAFWGLQYIPAPVRVHRGFLDAWTKNGFDKRVLDKIHQIINEEFSYIDPETGGISSNSGISIPWRCYVTGHSLGGALATLAAYDIKSAHPTAAMTVYTFGSPRVGNKSFAYEYNLLIPNHFAVISGQDPVARQPKGWYKRVGDRVLIDNLGNIIVRPTYLEMHLINRLGAKVSDHLVATYRLSLMRAIKTQVSKWKGEEGEDARDLARDLDLNMALLGVHLSDKELEDPSLEPMTLEQVQKKMLEARKV